MNPMRNQILIGDARAVLADLPSAWVDMVLASPPYFRLRDYQVSGQLGLEHSVEQWVDNLRVACKEIARVLVPHGSFWLNVGDSYSMHMGQGAARKSLLLGPERLALGLIRDGWCVRNKIVWQKANPMPSSAADRLSCTWEALYLLTRSPHYYFDLDAIRVPHETQPPKPKAGARRSVVRENWRGPNGDDATGLTLMKANGRIGHHLGKNPGDVWKTPTSVFRGAHHATMPAILAERAITAGCPLARCTNCRKPWRRSVEQAAGSVAVHGLLVPGCPCGAPREPGLVLDPFFGAGTTAVAAERLKRDWVGVELNEVFAGLAKRRITRERKRREEG